MSHSATEPTDEGSEYAQARGAQDDRSLGEIFGDVTKDLSALVRAEIDLAKTELKEEGTKAVKGAGMLGAAAYVANFVPWFLSLSLVFLLAKLFEDSGVGWGWASLASLIVALVWGVVAAVLGVVGQKKMKQANPQLPVTQQTLKEDAQWAKAQKS